MACGCIKGTIFAPKKFSRSNATKKNLVSEKNRLFWEGATRDTSVSWADTVTGFICMIGRPLTRSPVDTDMTDRWCGVFDGVKVMPELSQAPSKWYSVRSGRGVERRGDCKEGGGSVRKTKRDVRLWAGSSKALLVQGHHECMKWLTEEHMYPNHAICNAYAACSGVGQSSADLATDQTLRLHCAAKPIREGWLLRRAI